MRLKIFLFATMFSLALSGCQTEPKVAFSRIKNGMDKSQVIDLMGSPRDSYRRDNKDRWVYFYEENGAVREKVVVFDNGLVILSGDPPIPEAAAKAEVVDAKRETDVKLEAEQDKKRKEENAQAWTRYQNESKSQDKVRYIPEFQPVQ